MDLPPGVPVGLVWFAAWASLSMMLGALIRRLEDEGGQHHRELDEVTERALDELNEYLQRVVISPVAAADDPLHERPIRQHSGVAPLYRRALNAWRPLHRYDLVQRAGRLGLVFSVLHALAALGGGVAWYLADQHNAATVLDLAVFSALLVVVLAALGIQVWGHLCAGTQLKV